MVDDAHPLTVMRSVEARAAPVGRILAFGGFALHLPSRLLFEGDRPVRLGSRALAILSALVERPGELVTKQELVRVAWPETFVEEVNLRVHLAAIRRALRDSAHTPQFIGNISGRGYRFLAPVTDRLAGHAPAFPVVRNRSLPAASGRLVGRDSALVAIEDLLKVHRMVTLVGPGGVGKTALAAEATQALLGSATAGFAVVDLSTVGDERQLAAEVAVALNVPERVSPPTSITSQDTLIVLDSCEYMIAQAAGLSESLLRTSPRVRILATSIEPLRAAGERVFRVAPLGLPDRDNLGLDAALVFPAVKLLADRLSPAADPARFSRRDVRRLIAISRKLDGLPLAIEMAAARINVFGLQVVLDQLEAGISLLSDDRRTSAPRHRTLRDLLDANQTMLDDDEVVVLRRVSVFAGVFTLTEALAVAAWDGLTEGYAVTALAGLVAKSHLIAAEGLQGLRYRMPRPHRAHVHGQLAASPEHASVRRRHAGLMLARVRQALEDWRVLSRLAWMERHAGLVEELNETLDWCFAVSDIAMGAELASRSVPILLRAGQYGQVRHFALCALANADAMPAKWRLRLLLQLATLTEDQEGSFKPYRQYLQQAEPSRREIHEPWADAEYLLAEAAIALRSGEVKAAAARAGRAAEHARLAQDRDLELTATRLGAEAHHYAGDFGKASRMGQVLIEGPAWHLPPQAAIITSSHRGSMRVLEARRLWIEGFAVQARRVLFEALTYAAEEGPWPHCEAIGLGACPLLLWSGEDERSMQFVRQLETDAEHAGLPLWQSWAKLFRNAVNVTAMREGRRSEAVVSLQPTSFLQAETWVTLTGSLRGLNLSASTASGWCQPEVLRAASLAALASGDAARGTELLVEAKTLARRTGMLAWELRAAMALARHWRRDDPPRALDCIADVHGRFTEGHEDSDLIAAHALIRQLQGGAHSTA